MARKITTDAVNAFMSAQPFNRDNTAVVIDGPKAILTLHGYMIAVRAEGSDGISITSAGWFTNTTKERLNGIPGIQINQRKGVWFLNGEEWDGKWKTV